MSAPIPVKIAPNLAGLPCGPSYDFFIINQIASPGKATLLSCDAAQNWTVNQAAGFNWATVTPMGLVLCKPVFRIEVWTADDWQDLLTFATNFLSRPAPAQKGDTKSRALGFFHLIASGPPYFVTAVVVEKVTVVKQEGDIFALEMHFLEYRQPLPAPPRPTLAAPAVAKKPAVAKDQDQVTIQAQQAQIDALNKRVPNKPPGTP